jgi:hypothetical protein
MYSCQTVRTGGRRALGLVYSIPGGKRGKGSKGAVQFVVLPKLPDHFPCATIRLVHDRLRKCPAELVGNVRGLGVDFPLERNGLVWWRTRVLARQLLEKRPKFMRVHIGSTCLDFVPPGLTGGNLDGFINAGI